MRTVALQSLTASWSTQSNWNLFVNVMSVIQNFPCSVFWSQWPVSNNMDFMACYKFSKHGFLCLKYCMCWHVCLYTIHQSFAAGQQNYILYFCWQYWIRVHCFVDYSFCNTIFLYALMNSTAICKMNTVTFCKLPSYQTSLLISFSILKGLKLFCMDVLVTIWREKSIQWWCQVNM